MTKRIALAAVSAAALAAVTVATASGTAQGRTVKLKLDDAVDVVGTKVACFAIKSNGKKGVACVLWGNGKPLPKTYGAGLAVDGTAVVNRVNADGSGTVVIKRKPQSAARAATVYKLRVGDMFGFPITSTVSLGCKIIDVTSTALEPIYRGPKVSCWRATARAPLPRSWGISISDKFAGVFQFDANGDVSANGTLKRQPR